MNLLLDLHIIIIFATGAAVLYSDEEALAWIIGRRERLSARKVEWLHALVGLGLAGMITTGGLMFLHAPSFYLSQPAFIVKLGFIATLIINSFFIAGLSVRASTQSWNALTKREQWPLLASGALSALGWGGAILCGLLLR